MNAIVWGFDNDYSKVIEDLSSKGVINVKKYFYDNEDRSYQYKNQEISINDIVYCEDWFEKNQDEAKKYMDSNFDEHVYNQVYSFLLHYIDCESRQEKYGIKPFHHYINKFNLYYRYLYGIFKKEDINLCLFSNYTHMGIDVVIYAIAKALGIRTIFLAQSTIPNHYDKIFYFEDESDYGTFDFMKHIFDSKHYDIVRTTTNDYFYMSSIYNKNTGHRKHFSLFKKKKKQSSNFDIYQQTLNSFVGPVDYTKNYVYFPLHLQPEATTSCLGGIYCDQMLALERLSEIIPKDWYIYIKENPKQTYLMRSKNFFNRLRYIKNAMVVPTTESSAKLIKNAKIVSTISGTAGWEALCEGKPVILFGNAFYKRFEGVFVYNKELSFADVVKHKVDANKLDNDLNNLLSRMPTAVIDKTYFQTVPEHITQQLSNMNITNLIYNILSNKLEGES